ncbi:Mitochondrial arginine transporter BAC2, partial [Cucurbita argyrosperma subsp. sororia]
MNSDNNRAALVTDFWPEFVASSWGKEFVAGGFGGVAGVISGHPLDTLRIRQQQSVSGSAFKIVRNIIANDGPVGLYRGMSAPFASITFQNAAVFQIYAILSRAFTSSSAQSNGDPPSYKAVAMGGFGTGALQSFFLTPVELVKIRLQLQTSTQQPISSSSSSSHKGPLSVAKSIYKTEGLRGIYRGLTITMLRDAPAHAVYFWTYECMREQFQPGCRSSGEERFSTALVAGGLAGVASWVFCYPLDVLKTRIQAPTQRLSPRYKGIVDCVSKSVREEGYRVLWRGLETAVARAFVVNGTIFGAYGLTLRCLFSNESN